MKLLMMHALGGRCFRERRSGQAIPIESCLDCGEVAAHVLPLWPVLQVCAPKASDHVPALGRSEPVSGAASGGRASFLMIFRRSCSCHAPWERSHRKMRGTMQLQNADGATRCALNGTSIQIGSGVLTGYYSKPLRSLGETCHCQHSVLAKIVAVEMCTSGGSRLPHGLNSA